MTKLEDLTTNQRALIASYISQSRHFELSQGCSDLCDSDFEGWTDDEMKSLCKMIDEWNCTDDPDDNMADVMEIQSWMLVGLGAWLIQPESEAPNE